MVTIKDFKTIIKPIITEKSSMGSEYNQVTFQVQKTSSKKEIKLAIENIFKVSNINSTLKNLREKNFWVYGFDAKGQKDFTDIKWEGNNILLFGSEGFGMRQHTGKYADFFVKININEDIESLNISNSAAIVFHHLSYIKKKSWLFNK